MNFYQATHFAQTEFGQEIATAILGKLSLPCHTVTSIVTKAALGDDTSRNLIKATYGEVNWFDVVAKYFPEKKSA